MHLKVFVWPCHWFPQAGVTESFWGREGPLSSPSSLASMLPASPAQPQKDRQLQRHLLWCPLLSDRWASLLQPGLIWLFDDTTTKLVGKIFPSWQIFKKGVKENMILAFCRGSAKPPCLLIALHDLIRLNGREFRTPTVAHFSIY